MSERNISPDCNLGSDAGRIDSVVPVLAEKWSFPDPKTFVVELRRGVKFQNGEELTAERLLEAGLDPQAPKIRMLLELVEGDIVSIRATLIEGLTLEESARSLADQGLGTFETLRDAMRDPAAIADLDPEAGDLEGYLFPETYTFAKSTPAGVVVETLVDTFRARWRERVAPVLA